MRYLAPIFAVSIAALTTFGLTSTASADVVNSCGSIELDASASCEMRLEGGCTASCEPISFTAECAGDLYVGCQGGCTAQVDVNCTASCQASCQAQCEVNPGSFECAAACRGDCSGTCDARCVGANNTADCRASCKATCGGECDSQCKVVAPSANCTTQCQSCCSGSCRAEANMDCQLNCQSKGYLDCRTNLQGGCETACTQPDGALFCDGQYMDVGSQIDQCVAALEAAFQIEVTGYANGNAQCSGGSCTANAEAGISCAQSRGDTSGSALGVLGALAAFGLALGRRKK